MKTILAILQKAGGWHPGLYLKIDNAPYKELVIEVLDESGPCGLSRLTVEAGVLLAASHGNASTMLKEAATAYKVDTDAITIKMQQEFAAKERAKKASQSNGTAAKRAA